MMEDDNSEVIARFDCFAEVRAAARKRGWESDNWQPLASYVCPTCQAPKPLPLPEAHDWWSFIDVPARRQRISTVPVYEAALRLAAEAVEGWIKKGWVAQSNAAQVAATVREALRIGGVKP
jgi:hypothetical protein